MDGISNIAGERTTTLEHQGKIYTLTAMGLSQYAERENYILSRKPNPFDQISGLPVLPDSPAVPVPPDAGCTATEREAYKEKLTAYFEAKRRHDDAVMTRLRFEEAIRKEAGLPRFATFDDDARFDASLHGVGWRLWRALRNHHPEIDSVQAALDLLGDLGPSRFQEVIRKLERTEERDILPNSSGSETATPGLSEHPGP